MYERSEGVGVGGHALGPRPLYVQSAFALLLLIDVGVRLAQHGPDRLGWPLLGIALTLVLSGYVAVLDPPPQGDDLRAAIVSGLNILFLGLTLMTPYDSKASALVLLPCLWMGLRHGRTGAAVAAVLLTVAVVVLPSLSFGSAGVDRVEGLMLVVIGTVAALASGALAHQVTAARGAAQDRLSLLDAVIDTADVAILVLDLDGRVLLYNSAEHLHLGRRVYPAGYPEMDDGIHRLRTLGPDSRPLTYDERPDVRAVRGDEFDGFLVAIGTETAERTYASVSARAMRTPTGERVAVVLTTRDITERIRAIRTRDDFVAAASHELRTPLASLMGFVHLLRIRDDLPAEAATDLEAVDRNVRRLGRLVDDLVHTAQVGRAQLEVIRRQTDIADVVRRTVAQVDADAAAAETEIRVEAPDHLTGNIDEPQFAVALESLVRRAVARSPRPGVVRVRVEIEDDRLEVSVADDGAVLGPAERDRLFFSESGEIDLRDAAMVSCKRVVEGHGGRVETDPAAPGAVVRLRLPSGVAGSGAAETPVS